MQDHFFIAIPVPIQLRQDIHDKLKMVWNEEDFLKWVHFQDYHITLVFLGAIEQTQRKTLIEKINKYLINCPSFSLSISHPGIFGREQQPRIYWLGVEECDELSRLQNHIKEIARDCGVQVDSRPYQPHLTISRKWMNQMNFKHKFVPLEEKTFKVSNVVLFQTIPDREPKYKAVQYMTLGRDNK